MLWAIDFQNQFLINEEIDLENLRQFDFFLVGELETVEDNLDVVVQQGLGAEGGRETSAHVQVVRKHEREQKKLAAKRRMGILGELQWFWGYLGDF
jgi:hypothetical protein